MNLFRSIAGLFESHPAQFVSPHPFTQLLSRGTGVKVNEANKAIKVVVVDVFQELKAGQPKYIYIKGEEFVVWKKLDGITAIEDRQRYNRRKIDMAEGKTTYKTFRPGEFALSFNSRGEVWRNGEKTEVCSMNEYDLIESVQRLWDTALDVEALQPAQNSKASAAAVDAPAKPVVRARPLSAPAATTPQAAAAAVAVEEEPQASEVRCHHYGLVESFYPKQPLTLKQKNDIEAEIVAIRTEMEQSIKKMEAETAPQVAWVKESELRGNARQKILDIFVRYEVLPLPNPDSSTSGLLCPLMRISLTLLSQDQEEYSTKFKYMWEMIDKSPSLCHTVVELSPLILPREQKDLISAEILAIKAQKEHSVQQLKAMESEKEQPMALEMKRDAIICIARLKILDIFIRIGVLPPEMPGVPSTALHNFLLRSIILGLFSQNDVRQSMKSIWSHIELQE